MSLIEFSEHERLNPLDVVEGVAGTNNWSFERAGDEEITIVVAGRWTDYSTSAKNRRRYGWETRGRNELGQFA